MDGQGLQAVRGEIEAIVTFQGALNRLALFVDENAITEWTGPRPDDVDGLAFDDGSFSREELNEVRKQAGTALAARFKEVWEAVSAKKKVVATLSRAIAAATGGVVTLDRPEPARVLEALSRMGSIRLDWAENAATLVREELSVLAAPPPAKKPARARKPARAKAKGPKAATKTTKAKTKPKATSARTKKPARAKAAKKAVGKKPTNAAKKKR